MRLAPNLTKLAAVLLMGGLAFAQTTATVISDTIRVPTSNALFNGVVTFTPSHAMTCGANSYVPQPTRVRVIAGVLSLSLIPNASCLPVDSNGDPASYYTALWSAAGFSLTETLVVPVSATPVTLSALRSSIPSSATAVISPSQLTSAGATSGQAIVWNGSSWAPGTAVGSGAAWGTITGTLSDQTDLNSILSGKASTTHATAHQHGGSDEVATATAAANAIPKAGAGGTLDTAWIPTLNQNTTGNAATATALATPRTIYGTSFDGSANIGSRSGNTTEMATVSGTKTTNKQLAFDASGNVVASASDIGAGGSMVYPGAGVPNSTGSAWGTSYTVGTAANNLVQLNSSAELPAVSAANLTNFPTLNQNTTGTAAGLASQYIDWSAGSGGASIANKPNVATAAASGSLTTSGAYAVTLTATGATNVTLPTTGTLATTTGNVATATTLAANGANCSAGSYPLGVDASGAVEDCTAVPSAPARNYGCAVGDPAGSALSTGVLCYVVVPAACTITAWDILVDGGTATVDVWKVASGTAIPTDAASITASAVPAISSGTAIHSTTLTGWTTSITANDILGFNLDAVATAKFISATIQCQ